MGCRCCQPIESHMCLSLHQPSVTVHGKCRQQGTHWALSSLGLTHIDPEHPHDWRHPYPHSHPHPHPHPPEQNLAFSINHIVSINWSNLEQGQRPRAHKNPLTRHNISRSWPRAWGHKPFLEMHRVGTTVAGGVSLSLHCAVLGAWEMWGGRHPGPEFMLHTSVLQLPLLWFMTEPNLENSPLSRQW
jgi:hypothetical protein